MLAEFKKFIMKGDLVEIAVGLILALAFSQVVNAFVDGIISPIIGAIVGEPSFKDATLDIGDGVLLYGAFIDAVLNFLIVGFVLFLIVKAYNSMKERLARSPETATDPDEIVLLRDIRDAVQGRPAGGTPDPTR